MSFVIILSVILVLEFAFRVFLEIREARLFGKFVPFALWRCIPFINDFLPLPEAHAEALNVKFVEMHEECHKKMHHALFRNVAKLCFYVLMIMIIVMQLGSGAFSLIEIILWFHVGNVIFKVIYHAVCWNQETECDTFAAKKLGKYEARKELSRLARTELPMSLLFAFVYREHPLAVKRRERFL